MRAVLLAGIALGAVLLSATLSGSDEATIPERLRDTGIDELGRPFSPQYPLWTDGADKARRIYLPPGTSIDARDVTNWDFPVGTKFWKEFSFNSRKAETRMLWKIAPARWLAVTYAWNEDGTDAILVPAGGALSNVEAAPGRPHTIPSRDECLMCHGTRRTGPLGFNALQLSTDRDPNAIHGEPLARDMLTLRTLVDERSISREAAQLLTNPPRIATSDPQTRAVLGYLSTNCGSCHDGRGEIAALGPILRMEDLLQDGDAVARSFVNQPTKWQVPGLPEGASVVVSPDVPDKSALLVRMRSRRPSSQMPPLGTSLRDDRALASVTRWLSVQIVRSH